MSGEGSGPVVDLQPREVEELSEGELELYSRQIVLQGIGYDGQLKLRNGKVCVVGMGGLGCTAAMQLVAMGTGLLRIVDHDVVEASNLHRQHLYDPASIGVNPHGPAAAQARRSTPDRPSCQA